MSEQLPQIDLDDEDWKEAETLKVAFGIFIGKYEPCRYNEHDVAATTSELLESFTHTFPHLEGREIELYNELTLLGIKPEPVSSVSGKVKMMWCFTERKRKQSQE